MIRVCDGQTVIWRGWGHKFWTDKYATSEKAYFDGPMQGCDKYDISIAGTYQKANGKVYSLTYKTANGTKETQYMMMSSGDLYSSLQRTQYDNLCSQKCLGIFDTLSDCKKGLSRLMGVSYISESTANKSASGESIIGTYVVDDGHTYIVIKADGRAEIGSRGYVNYPNTYRLGECMWVRESSTTLEKDYIQVRYPKDWKTSLSGDTFTIISFDRGKTYPSLSHFIQDDLMSFFDFEPKIVSPLKKRLWSNSTSKEVDVSKLKGWVTLSKEMLGITHRENTWYYNVVDVDSRIVITKVRIDHSTNVGADGTKQYTQIRFSTGYERVIWGHYFPKDGSYRYAENREFVPLGVQVSRDVFEYDLSKVSGMAFYIDAYQDNVDFSKIQVYIP